MMPPFIAPCLAAAIGAIAALGKRLVDQPQGAATLMYVLSKLILQLQEWPISWLLKPPPPGIYKEYKHSVDEGLRKHGFEVTLMKLFLMKKHSGQTPASSICRHNAQKLIKTSVLLPFGAFRLASNFNSTSLSHNTCVRSHTGTGKA